MHEKGPLPQFIPSYYRAVDLDGYALRQVELESIIGEGNFGVSKASSSQNPDVVAFVPSGSDAAIDLINNTKFHNEGEIMNLQIAGQFCFD